MNPPCTRIAVAIDQLCRSRAYLLLYLDRTDERHWFAMPPACPTHIAWQVGHLAMATYWLTMLRVRGKRDGDDTLIPSSFLELFGRGSTPCSDPAKYASPAEIRAVLDRVHEQALAELPHVPDSDLDLPPIVPHDLFDTRLGAIHWCARHEMLHTGKIGLIRRMLGAKPVR